MPISRACEEQRDNLRSQVQRLQGCKKGNEELLQSLQDLEDKVLEGGQQQRDGITRMLARLEELIQSKRQKLLQQSLVEQEVKQNQIHTQMDKTRNTLDVVDKLLSRAEEMLRLESEYSFLTIVLPLVEDTIRISSRPVEPVTQVQTVLKSLHVDSQVRSISDIELVLVGSQAFPTVTSNNRTMLAGSNRPTIPATKSTTNAAPASPVQDTSQSKARVLTMANSRSPTQTSASKTPEPTPASVLRVYRPPATADK
jgi:hypothetical protein